jgi:hypothetical protein
MSVSRVRSAVSAWNRFWFAPAPTSTLAIVRIALGLVVAAWGLSLAGDLFAFFGPHGIQPSPPRPPGSWGLLDLSDGDLALGAIYASLLVGAGALAVGFHVRLAALVVFVCMVSLEREAPYVLNAGDHLLRILVVYVMLAPSGAALSVDRWRAGQQVWTFPERPQWGLRLMQLQLSFVYLAAVWAKARGVTWNDGTAISYALRLTDLERFPVPTLVTEVPAFANVLTYATLGIELSLAILVWNRRLRPWVLGLGVLLHLGIDWSLRVGFFTLAVLVMYLAFIPPERASSAIRRARHRVLAVTGRLSSRSVLAGGSTSRSDPRR